MKYSIIIPVYNRPDEVEELLESLVNQTGNFSFEMVIVEDGSTLPCDKVIEQYKGRLSISYHTKPNTGRSDTRNVGMELAKGDYFLFFDSDCVLPPQYFATLDQILSESYSDCFGGPDAAHESFSSVQKAISYAMTSFFTTGGIRGGKQQLEKFKPRTFNMGFSRAVYEKVGGFRDMFGEDIDLSIRIADAGFSIALYRDAFVYHRRRVSFRKFYKQVRNFGSGRISLALLHKGSMKLVHTLPALFLVGAIGIIILSVFLSLWFWLFPVFYTLLLLADAFIKTKSVKTALLAVWASYIQLVGYGWGFITAFVQKILLGRGLESSETLKKVYK
ncbi:MAG: glycosyltransferase [Prevotellaceae bacterium]|jgi:glycosyltransferase involved in cell wall biosynthesis|nr:glycosyltransferase [Prevotellaceae bacterium]